MGTPSLSTRLAGPRVALRAPKPGDVRALGELMRLNVEHLRPWSPAAPPGHNPHSLVSLAKTIVNQRRAWRDDRAYTFLVEHDGALVGRVSLTEVSRGPFQNVFLGYWIDRERQGLGLTTEAVGLAVDFALGPLELHRVQAGVMPHNAASRRVLGKLGFREEGVSRRYLRIAGAWQDHVIYAKTKEDEASAPSSP